MSQDKAKKVPLRPNWTPLDGVAIGINEEVKKDGVVTRGCKNTSRGKTARGPLA